MMPGSAYGSKLVFSAQKSTKAKTSIRYVFNTIADIDRITVKHYEWISILRISILKNFLPNPFSKASISMRKMLLPW